MLDDGVPYAINNCMCMRNLGDTKEVARRTIGGLMVAFLRDALEDQHEVGVNPGLAPAVIKPVAYDLA
uniref:Uncharacterized protein n=1 Tax=Oryza rufipogon TaxID=4529 RepID=A0A0E0ND71_ORYRU